MYDIEACDMVIRNTYVQVMGSYHIMLLISGANPCGWLFPEKYYK